MIRKALDGGGFEDIAIMSYAAKYCSGFYGPFREAAESAPQFGDRRGYQMDPSNAREALREVELDISEGADMVMVKPALPYLDMHSSRSRDVCRTRWRVQRQRRVCDGQGGSRERMDRGKACRVLEILTAIHRAGASIVLTYHAKDVSRWLKNG